MDEIATPFRKFNFSPESKRLGRSLVVCADSFEWLAKAPRESIHAVVTDPPYGVREYEAHEIALMSGGERGIWRLPPAYDGHKRAPLPRFADLSVRERNIARRFFLHWATLLYPVLRPGGHAFVAANSFLQGLVVSAIAEAGFEFRGCVIRLVRTMRGGDKPKNAEKEFPGVCSFPRSCYEPWAIFRKPIPAKLTIRQCLEKYQTGGLRRLSVDSPLDDVIPSERTAYAERRIAPHPSLKPQAFMRRLVTAALPLGTGVILDTFMGSGSTVAAAEAVGLSCIGIERHPDYYNLSLRAIPQLSEVRVEPEHGFEDGRQT